MAMDFVSTARAPKAIGPYSQAVLANGFLFTAGQVALDPDKGELVAGNCGADHAGAGEPPGRSHRRAQ